MGSVGEPDVLRTPPGTQSFDLFCISRLDAQSSLKASESDQSKSKGIAPTVDDQPILLIITESGLSSAHFSFILGCACLTCDFRFLFSIFDLSPLSSFHVGPWTSSRPISSCRLVIRFRCDLSDVMDLRQSLRLRGDTSGTDKFLQLIADPFQSAVR